MQGVRRQGLGEALRRAELRRLQGILQAQHPPVSKGKGRRPGPDPLFHKLKLTKQTLQKGAADDAHDDVHACRRVADLQSNSIYAAPFLTTNASVTPSMLPGASRLAVARTTTRTASALPTIFLNLTALA